MGLLVGPVLGSLFYSFLGYFYTFVAFSAILAIITIPIYLWLPNYLNNEAIVEDEEELDKRMIEIEEGRKFAMTKSSKSRVLTYSHFLTNLRC